MDHMDNILANSKEMPYFNYDMMFASPWACHSDYEDEHRQIMKVITENLGLLQALKVY